VEVGENVEKWKVVKPNGAVLHDDKTGFDAIVFVNEDTKQVVVAFRGTEGTGPFKRAYPDIKKADETLFLELSRIEKMN
jgi:hypothetical protein